MWVELCENENIESYFSTDVITQITPLFIENNMKKILLKALDKMADLIIFLLSGHGKADNNSAYLFLLYDYDKFNNDEKIKLKWYDYSTRLKHFLVKNEQLISRGKLSILFLMDTCYSGNVLHFNYELTNTKLPLTKTNFQYHEYDPENPNEIKRQNIWIVGASKKLTHVTCTLDEFSSDFTKLICKLNTLNQTTLSQSLVKIKSLFPECTIFFSQI